MRSNYIFGRNESAGYFGLLSDEVLLMILKRLPSPDLYNLLRTCRRLHGLCQEDILWTEIENPPDNKDMYQFTVDQLLNPKTKRFKLSSVVHPSSKGYRSSIPPSLCRQLMRSGKNLHELHLVRQKFDGNYFRLHDLPVSLKILNMSGSVVSNVNECSSYLKLQNVDLSYCSFVTAHSLMAISKLPKLEKLVLKGCRKIGECLAYVALSSRFGFQTLKVLDVTDTRVGSSEFTAFAGIRTLEEFYFGQYDPFVDYECNYITDMCLTRTQNSSSLKVLDMSGSRVTDRTLEVLQSLRNLTRVDAHFTQISDGAIDMFHRNKPNCRIHKVVNVSEIVPHNRVQHVFPFGSQEGGPTGPFIVIRDPHFFFNPLQPEPPT